MVKLFNILTVSLAILIVATSGLKAEEAPVMMINVFAGNDTTICVNASLNLDDLNATISGAVDDGNWFTNGDGLFTPSSQSYGGFGEALTYLPGPQDITSGFFVLILASDDPDGIGPLQQVTAEVRVDLQGNPVMVCNSNLNISLDETCTQLVTPDMILTNPVAPYALYDLTLSDQNGNIITDNILRNDHIGQNISFDIGHMCGGGSCWGVLTAQDKLPATLQCATQQVSCLEETTPEVIGLPVPLGATFEKIGNATYLVDNLDACSQVNLTYQDTEQDMPCTTTFTERIIRQWFATDEYNNTSSCTQVITIEKVPLEAIALPDNFDDSDQPSISCDSTYATLLNGNPDPSVTGIPEISGCSNLEFTYTDTRFYTCGSTYKILREWLIIDWCINETIEFNQIIKISDKKAPTYIAPSDTLFYTDVYDCWSEEDTLMIPTEIMDCSDVNLSISIFDSVEMRDLSHLITMPNDSVYLVSGLPLGESYVTYIMKDECGNADTTNAYIVVEDNKKPSAICDGFTVVSLINDNYVRLEAESINNFSLDNCELVKYEVAKMDDPCYGQSGVFRDFVDFCCEESGLDLMVSLRVTDASGNSNTCMAQVKVQDKIAPTITCPPNLTISIDEDFDLSDLSAYGTVVADPSQVSPIIINDAYNNGWVGSDGIAEDNCFVELDSLVTDNLECGLGSIFRTWTVTDQSQNDDDCTQRITIQDSNPFDATDITWPMNVDIDGCYIEDVDSSLIGVPTFRNTLHTDLNYSYYDDIFDNSLEACVKILRNWTVIDWCKFDGTGNGQFTYVQVIKLDNEVDPEIVDNCSDTIVCNNNLFCEPVSFIYQISATDDCTPADLIGYEWLIKDELQNEVASGTRAEVVAQLDNGMYSLEIVVTDICGNTASCSRSLTVKDCKRPTPVCESSATTVLMPSTKSISLLAEDFDYNSMDNCTPRELLRYSFSTDVNDTTKVYTCVDIENGVSEMLEVDLWVTDLEGNNEKCTVEIIIQDNNDVCGDDLLVGNLAGRIISYEGNIITDAQVQALGGLPEYSGVGHTDQAGFYDIDGLAIDAPYTISASKETTAESGVTTRDLIVIQRHILFNKRFTEAYQYLAADANGNHRVSASDLSTIRKVILGITNVWPTGVKTWSFVPADYEFEDVTKPFDFEDTISIRSFTGEEVANFYAVKTGDVDDSFEEGRTSNRSVESMPLIADLYSDKVNFVTSDRMMLSGFQMEIAFDKNRIDSISIAPSLKDYVFYEYLDKSIKLLMYTPSDIEFDMGESLFTIHTNDRLSRIFLADAFQNEIYVDLETYQLVLETVSDTKEVASEGDLVAKVVNNTLHIQSTESKSARAEVFSSNGIVVFERNIELISGETQMTLPILPAGMYFIRLQTEKQRIAVPYLSVE